ncbi:hypothetical protein E0Z10_g266 [Xylaria hypoxylon]|uniref:Uncharacterized protein n=1 Tax=Xylaria hypoxylon TaxID=37992 RepID=A0A4Z0Z9D6_9PEZI|nr:hypothetical protein E0Z10_g266 [Xylaria hypoxylon]
MPSRINLPKLSLFSSRDNSSSSLSLSSSSSSLPPSSKMAPPAPASKASLTPVSPPARLHLRNILPSSPEEPPMMPLPPRTPRAWVWQCHKCLNVYRLGCTRRCLDCSHTYCVSNTSGSNSSPRGKKRRRNTGLCGAEFDYVGWEQWGSWRRNVLGHEAVGRCETKARDRAFLKKSHDCWIDCDSPSECCHRRYELAAEVLRKQTLVKSTNRQPNPDDDIPITEVLHESAGKDEAEETPPKSPLGQSSFLWDEDEEEKKTREEDEAEKKERAAQSSLTPDSKHDSSGSGTGSGTDRYPPGVDDHDWANVVDNYDYYGDLQDRPVKRLTVRNLAKNDVDQENSDSDSESDGSGWSTNSSESDDSSIETRAGTKLS